MIYKIYPPEGIIETEVELPCSKSEYARRILISAYGGYELPEVPSGSCEDVKVLYNALSLSTENAHLDKTGDKCPSLTLHLGLSATALRFLTTYFAMQAGATVVLDGEEGLRHRPMGVLVEALRSLGAEIQYLDKEGFAPIRIIGKELAGGEVILDPGISSQWLSSLMLGAPYMTNSLTIKMISEPPSFPYITLTAREMAKAGVDAEVERLKITVPRGSYREISGELSRDWGCAAFWYEICAMSAGWATLKGLEDDKLQADSMARTIFERLGVVTEFTEEGAELSASPEMYSRLDFYARDCPDVVPAAAVCACTLGVPFKISGVTALAYKETDRLKCLAEELSKTGCHIEISPNGVMEWNGRGVPVREMPVLDTHGDHRLAMALAAISIFVPGIWLRDPECVAKSWPGYWDSLRRAGFNIESNV